MSNPYDDPNFSYDDSPDLYLFTSLTAGSSHIITATSRLETILEANRVPFHAIDCATDEKARRIWTRRAQGKKLPGLVREGVVLGDLEVVEEWNEYGEIKEHLGGPPLAKKQVRQPAQDTVGGGNMAAQPLPIRTKEASSETTTAAQTLQNSQAALLAQQAAAAGKARANKGPTPGVDSSKVRSLADAELDPETVKNTEKNVSPDGEKKTSPLEAAAASGETMATARSSATSPEADNADVNLSSPPTSTATIAHGAISAAQETPLPAADKADGILKDDNAKGEETEAIKKETETPTGEDSAVKNGEVSKETETADKDASSAAPASTSSLDATANEDAPTAAGAAEKPNVQKVSFAPDATREDAEKKEPKKAFEEEAAANKKEHSGEDNDKATAAKKEDDGDKTEDAGEKKEIAGAKDPDAAGESVED